MVSNRARRRREFWCKEVKVIGNLLQDAITLERHFHAAYSRQAGQKPTLQWRVSRRAVASLVQDYAAAVARYRRSIRASFRAGTRG